MITRRKFLEGGASTVLLGLLSRRGFGFGPQGMGLCPHAGSEPMDDSRPFAPMPLYPNSVIVDGLPFASGYTGEGYPDPIGIPFHSCENCFENGEPPAPTEEVDVAVVGGGISGLATAYLLRRHHPVVFELHSRYGGSAQGEIWDETRYSLGNAYVITPDPGTFLNSFYRLLGLHRVRRLHNGEDLVELEGEILGNFWSGGAGPPEDVPAFERFAEVVAQMGNESYPDIPLIDGQDNQWIIDLDQSTFKDDLQQRMGMPIPSLLAGAIQAYVYSSFAAGWQQISAAGGWNFLAAEQFGRWIFPGGNAYMAHQLWGKLANSEQHQPPGARRCNLRGNCRVVDVRLAPKDKVQVTYRDAEGQFRSLLAKRVAMCCPKRVCKRILHDLVELDTPKVDAMYRLDYNAYLVVNVLLDAPIQRDFYDVFLLGDGNFPMTESEAELNSRVVDALNGHYTRQPPVPPSSVLTLYWPLPFARCRVGLIADGAWDRHAAELVPQIQAMLAMFEVNPKAVRQVRITRWAHALPINAPGLMADGTIEHLRRPLEDKIYFINQDNWALPAVENCLLDAEIYAPQIAAGL